MDFLFQDVSMFTEGQGSQVIWGVADYWVSRVAWNPVDHKYHLLGKKYICHCNSLLSKFVSHTAIFFFLSGVMPPDEYYYSVNNSVYTNTVAKLR